MKYATIIIYALLLGIVIFGANNRLNQVMSPHHDDKKVMRSIQHMSRNQTLDPSFYNHPNHVGIYVYYLVFSVVNTLEYSSPLYESMATNPERFTIVGSRISQAISTIEIVAAFAVGTQFSPIIGLLFAFGIADFPELIYRSDNLRPDTLFNTLYTMNILLLSLYWKHPSVFKIALCAFSLALLTATKYYGIALLPVVIAIIFWRNTNRLQTQAHLIYSVFFYLCSLLLVAPYLFLHSRTVISILRYESRDSHGEMSILGFFGNIMYYIERYIHHTNILMAMLTLIGFFYVKKYPLLIITISCSSILWISLSSLSLHWSRWGLPIYSSWLLLGSISGYEIALTVFNWLHRLIALDRAEITR